MTSFSQMSNSEFKTDSISATLRAQNHVAGGGSECLITNRISHPPYAIGNGQACNIGRLQEVSPTLNCMHDPNLVVEPHEEEYRVRKLMPEECCRLQGFPDWYEDGIEGSDNHRYKMWGNGMCLMNILYIFEGLKDALESEP